MYQHRYVLNTLITGRLGRGLLFVFTDVSGTPSDAIFSVGNNWHGVRTVSYTHLDVYKRQL